MDTVSGGREQLRRSAHLGLLFLLLACALVFPALCAAGAKTVTVKGRVVMGENMTSAQGRRAAIDDARMRAIEQVAGVSTFSASIYSDGFERANYLQSLTRGFIVGQSDPVFHDELKKIHPNEPSVRVLTVTMDITVEPLPQAGENGFEMAAALLDSDGEKSNHFRAGKFAEVRAAPLADCWLYVFSIDAADKVVRLFPNVYQADNRLAAGEELSFPRPGSGVALQMAVVAGMDECSEAFLVVAFREEQKMDELIPFGLPLELNDFYSRLVKLPLADATMKMLPYTVVAQQ